MGKSPDSGLGREGEMRERRLSSIMGPTRVSLSLSLFEEEKREEGESGHGRPPGLKP